MICTARFEACCQKVFSGEHLQTGVGSLGEKPLHAVLKNYYCENPSNQEINIASFVADIAQKQQIIEVQTANFGSLREKLDFFLTQSPVRVVYPVSQIKWVRWIDPDTGELTARRRSPKKTAVYAFFRELYSLGAVVNHPKLCFTLAVLEVEEHRLLDGWSKDRKKGASKIQTLPLAFLEEISLDCPADFLRFLPPGLPKLFSAKDLQNEIHLTQKQTFYLSRVLRTLGVITEVGRVKNRILYEQRSFEK